MIQLDPLFIISSVILVLAVYMLIEDQCITIGRYTIHSDKIPSNFEGFRILHISDLHNKTFGKNNHRLMNKIKKEKPDLIVVTGDMVSSKPEQLDCFIQLATYLVQLAPTFLVMGNHELMVESRYPGFAKGFLRSMQEIGVQTMDNRMCTIQRGSDTIRLAGLTQDLSFYQRRIVLSSDTKRAVAKMTQLTAGDVKRTLGPCAPSEYHILLTHNPMHFSAYANWGADLTLAGHMHGGVIYIPGVGGLLSPRRSFFPKYCRGMHQDEGKVMVINRGLRNALCGLRFMNPPECTRIDLQCTK